MALRERGATLSLTLHPPLAYHLPPALPLLQRRLAEAERLEAAAQAAMDSVAQRAGLNSASEALWTQ